LVGPLLAGWLTATGSEDQGRWRTSLAVVSAFYCLVFGIVALFYRAVVVKARSAGSSNADVTVRLLRPTDDAGDHGMLVGP
jgi:hypothetical protein